MQGTVQKTAEAIAAVLRIEVEIADSNLVRVAGTGQYQDQCGQVMANGVVYQYVLQTGNTVIIENPGEHELCQPCSRRGQCSENAEMASPILLDGKPMGVIGLVSFDLRQKQRLLDNRGWMLQFIVKMAELIAGNIPATAAAGANHAPLNLNNLEKEAIIQALAKVSGNVRSKDIAAEILGISRATLYRKIKQYDIDL
jgi:transcriptional regulator with GAF, ATPase, and Fis domain